MKSFAKLRGYSSNPNLNNVGVNYYREISLNVKSI